MRRLADIPPVTREWDGALAIRLGDADLEFLARVRYRSAPFMVDIERIEIRVGGNWTAAPWLIDLLNDNPAFFDQLRRHAADPF